MPAGHLFSEGGGLEPAVPGTAPPILFYPSANGDWLASGQTLRRNRGRAGARRNSALSFRPPQTPRQPLTERAQRAGNYGDAMSILTVQRKLAAAGFDPGPQDGVWGRRTEAALDAALAAARPAPAPPSSGALDVALRLIKRWEGCKLTAYPDPGTGGEPYTIGWGSTGPGITKGTVWTQQQADDRLAADVRRFMSAVEAVLTRPATANQLGAMTSLAYNIGSSAFASSTLVRKFNAGDISGAAAEFDRWNRAGGRVMQGLVNRRADERKVFEAP